MYYANPIALFGVAMIGLGLLLFIWRRLAKQEVYRLSADLAVRTVMAWGLFFFLFGAVLGFFHAGSHAECEANYAAAPDDPEQWVGCQYFFERYGGGPAE